MISEGRSAHKWGANLEHTNPDCEVGGKGSVVETRLTLSSSTRRGQLIGFDHSLGCWYGSGHRQQFR